VARESDSHLLQVVLIHPPSLRSRAPILSKLFVEIREGVSKDDKLLRVLFG
jgi:hypothetical protein